MFAWCASVGFPQHALKMEHEARIFHLPHKRKTPVSANETKTNWMGTMMHRVVASEEHKLLMTYELDKLRRHQKEIQKMLFDKPVWLINIYLTSIDRKHIIHI